MFTKPKNIETSFRHIRAFTMLVIVSSILLTGFVIYKSCALVSEARQSIYILANGKALEALNANRHENIPVEARDHVKTFHEDFFTLDPDEKVIQSNITKALYLSDASAKREFDNLTEQGYYRSIISGNVSQKVFTDSVAVSLDSHPYRFRYYGKLEITRPTSTVTRSLITEGDLREVSRSDNNPHGFIIEKWHVVDNRDIKIKAR